MNNPLKKALQTKTPLLGTWCFSANATITEILSLAGFDWILIDMEHGYGDYQELLSQLHAIQSGNSAPVVRVRANDRSIIKRILDMGAQSIMVPMVNNVEDCLKAVQACRYPPAGCRGIGPTRAAQFDHFYDYLQHANDNIVLMVQIESSQGVDNVGDIVNVPGVDVVVIGPNDLAASLEHLGDLKHPDVSAAIEKVERAVAKAKLPLLTVCCEWSEAAQLFAKGYRMVSIQSDVTLLMQSAKNLVLQFQDKILKK